MPRKANVVSIKELRRILAAKEGQMERLLARREKLLSGLESVDAQIAAVGGDVPSGRTPSAKAPRPQRAAERATGRTLVDFTADVLKGASQGMRVKDVMVAVADAGYTSSSKDFYGIIAAALRENKQFKKLRRGVYALA